MTKTAPVFPNPNRVRLRPSPSNPPILPVRRHSPTNDTRARKKKKIKPTDRDPSVVISSSCQHHHIVRFVPFVVIWTERASLVAIASNHSVCPTQLRAGRCYRNYSYVGSCSTELVIALKCVVLQDRHPTNSRPIRSEPCHTCPFGQVHHPQSPHPKVPPLHRTVTKCPHM